MEFQQKKNKNHIRVVIKKNGIDYHIQDPMIDKQFFVPFEDLSNRSYSFKEQNNGMKNFAIYTGVMGSLFLFINLLYETRFWSWLFLLSSPFFYWRYKASQIAFIVIECEQSPQLYLIKDGQEMAIYDALISARNKYLRTCYAAIHYENSRAAELQKFGWLYDLGVITEREYSFLKDELMA